MLRVPGPGTEVGVVSGTVWSRVNIPPEHSGHMPFLGVEEVVAGLALPASDDDVASWAGPDVIDPQVNAAALGALHL